MKTLLAVICLVFALALSFSVTALTQDTELPTGELARGTIQPVPQGPLVIGVVDGGIDEMVGTTVIGAWEFWSFLGSASYLQPYIGCHTVGVINSHAA